MTVIKKNAFSFYTLPMSKFPTERRGRWPEEYEREERETAMARLMPIAKCQFAMFYPKEKTKTKKKIKNNAKVGGNTKLTYGCNLARHRLRCHLAKEDELDKSDPEKKKKSEQNPVVREKD